MAQFFEWAVWAFFAIFKFAITPSAMIAANYHFTEAFIVTGVGATVGLIAFYHSGHAIFDSFNRLFRKKNKPKKIFTKKNRRIIRFKKDYGLSGLAFVSVILSVPLVGILAGKYFRHTKRAFPVLLIAFWLWSLILTYVTWTIKYRS